MKWRVCVLFLLACQTRVETANVGISVKGLTAIDESVGFSRDEIAQMQLIVTCDDGQSATLTGERGDDDHFIFVGAPVCARASLDVTITRATLTGGVTAIIGSAETSIVSPSVNVVFQARRFGELVVSYEDGARECTITAFDEAPHRHEAESITVTADPNSPSIALQVGDYSVTCGEATWVVAVPFAERLVTTEPPKVVVESNDASLSGLAIAPGVLVPKFTSTTFDYVLRIPSGVLAVDLTATATSPKASVKIGTTVGTGELTAQVSGMDTPFVFTIEVTSEDGTQTRTYSFEAQTMSSDASLSALTLSVGTLTPAFSPTGQGPYEVLLPDAIRSLTITATPASATATGVAISGIMGSPQTVTLSGPTQSFAIVVTAEDGTTATETLVVRHGLLSGLSAAVGSLSPAFAPATRRYDVKSTSCSGMTQVAGTPVSPSVVVTINGITGNTGFVNITNFQPNANAAVVKAITAQNLFEEYWISVDCGTAIPGLIMTGPSGLPNNLRSYVIAATGTTGAMGTSQTGSWPTVTDPISMASNPRGKVVGIGQDSTVTPLNHFGVSTVAIMSIVTSTPTTAPMRSLSYLPSGTRAWAHNGASTLRSANIDPATGSVLTAGTGNFTGTGSLSALAIEPAGRHMYAATGGPSGAIYRFDPNAANPSQFSDSIAHANITELIAHPSGASLFAVSGDSVTTFLIDRNSGKLSDPQTTVLGGVVRSLAISMSGLFAATAHASTTLSLLELTSEGRVNSITTPTNPSGNAAHLVAFQLKEPDLMLYVAETTPASVLRGYRVSNMGTLVNSGITSPGGMNAPPNPIFQLGSHTVY